MSLQRKQTLSEIMTAFRIPQILLGGEGDTYTKATAQAAEANYASTMVEPALTYIDQVLTKNVRRDYKNDKLVIVHDPVSPKDVEENLKYYKDMISFGGLKINEVRQMENFDPFPYELADVPLINVGGALVRLDTGEQLGATPNNVQDTEEVEDTEDTEEMEDSKMVKSEEMDLHWKQFNRKINHDLKWF